MAGLEAQTFAVADLYITPQLDLRRAGPIDHLSQKKAIMEIARNMADQPEEVLPRFVELAMQLVGGVAAGLSLYEPDPSPGVFRWRYLRGVLAPFEDATTPRNFSPCGITLDRNGPVLSLHPERVYDWISDAGIEVPEVLLVPLYIGGDQPLGTLWIVAETEGHFHRGHAESMTELASFVDIALRMRATEQKLQTALSEQETLTHEISHRIKNLFAITDGLIRVTARSAGSKQEMAELLSGRLHALASAHSLVGINMRDTDGRLTATDLASLVRAVVHPHETAEGTRFSVTGPSIVPSEQAATGLALIFHEMATNAAKYGALSVDGGRVDVSWERDGDALVLRWTERGGPPVAAPPKADGFGTGLVRKTVVGQFAGALDYGWARDGLTVTMRLPLARVSPVA